MLRLQSQWSIHSFITVRVPRKEPSHKMQGKHTAIVHRAPWGRKAYMQWGAAWFPKGIVNNTAMDLWEADSPPQVGL